MNQSEYETLMMAHDNLQRELSDIKRLIGKDKHALIKILIARNREVSKLRDVIRQDSERVQELKVHKDIYYKTLEKIGDPKNGWNPLAIEARIAIEKVGNLEGEQ